MDYKHLDNPDAVGKQGLHAEALQMEERAFLAECSMREKEAHMGIGKATQQEVATLRSAADTQRAEALLYAKAAELSDDDTLAVRKGFLDRWQHQVETAHASRNLLIKTKQSLGVPMADRDDVLLQLETTHKLIDEIRSDIEGPQKPAKSTRAKKAGAKPARQ